MSLIRYVKRLKDWLYRKSIETNIVKYTEYIIAHSEAKVGKNCLLYNGSLGDESWLVEIGDDVMLTAGVKILTHDGCGWVLKNMGYLKNPDKLGKVVIGNNVYVGINTVILPNVKIGDNVIIGAQSVVTKDIPSNSVAAGSPCRVICSIEEFKEKQRGQWLETLGMNPEEKRTVWENSGLL